MKTLIAAIVISIAAFAGAARADQPATPTSLCQQGPVVAACPSGVPSNIGVADPYSRYNGGAGGVSVTGNVSGNNSVAGTNSIAQSVAAPANNFNSNSVAWQQPRSSDSVAFSSSTGNSGTSVAAGGWGGGSSASVVH